MKINFSDDFENEIFNKSLDLSTDYAEASLDLIFEDGLLKELPIVKTLFTFYNITSSIIAQHNVKKILVFLQEFHSHRIEDDKIKKFKKQFNKDLNYRNEVLETVLIYIERFTDVKKSKILANLFIAYINENLSWKDFQKMTFILNTLNPSSFDFMAKYFELNSSKSMIELVEGEAFLLASGIATKFEDRFSLTRTGISIYEFGIKPLKKK